MVSSGLQISILKLNELLGCFLFQGLAFDNWDLDYYTELFKVKLARNPTSVECFDLAQSNSEHSRHWFFKVNNNNSLMSSFMINPMFMK